jgi:hypothetical protein
MSICVFLFKILDFYTIFLETFKTLILFAFMY